MRLRHLHHFLFRPPQLSSNPRAWPRPPRAARDKPRTCGDSRGHTPPVQPVARAEGHEARQSRAATKATRRAHGLQTKDPQASGSGFRARGQPRPRGCAMQTRPSLPEALLGVVSVRGTLRPTWRQALAPSVVQLGSQKYLGASEWVRSQRPGFLNSSFTLFFDNPGLE